MANGNPAKAIEDASKALTLDPNSVDALIGKALGQIAVKDGNGAMESLNEVVMIAPDNHKSLLLRAYVNQELLNNGKAAVGDLNRIIIDDADAFPAIAYKGIAQVKVGKKLDGDATVEKGLNADSTKNDYYWAAVYYAQTGNLEKAKEMLEKATFIGYQNQYAIKGDNTPWLNLGPIRHLNK